MTEKIMTYQDLLDEKERMENLLKTKRERISQSAASLEAEFKPAFSAISFLGTLVSRDITNPVLGTAANSIIDLVLKKLVLGRAGWIARFVLPAVAKNLSSHYIADHEGEIFRKVLKLFGFGKKKKQKKGEPEKSNGQVATE